MASDHTDQQPSSSAWTCARSLTPEAVARDGGLHCALVPDVEQDRDHIAVVYNTGDTPPEITIEEVSGTVHTVCANGVAVAVVARASGRAPHADDVLLVERVL